MERHDHRAMVTLTVAAGSTSGSVVYSVSENMGAARTSSITIAWTGGGAALTVNQEAAPTIVVEPPTVGGP